jgi:hypothetical protein
LLDSSGVACSTSAAEQAEGEGQYAPPPWSFFNTQNTRGKAKSVRLTIRLVIVACFLVGASRLEAAPILLDFEGFKNIPAVDTNGNGTIYDAKLDDEGNVVPIDIRGAGELVQSAYGGGAGSLGTVKSDYGITFAENAAVAIDYDALDADGKHLGMGATQNTPSGSGALFFQDPEGDETSTVMNVESGFTDILKFYFSTTTGTGRVTIYDGYNGTGHVLDTRFLPRLDPNWDISNYDKALAPGPNDWWVVWAPGLMKFQGVGRSVVFEGLGNQIAFDNIELNPVPEPSSLLLLATGLGWAALRRRRNETA